MTIPAELPSKEELVEILEHVANMNGKSQSKAAKLESLLAADAPAVKLLELSKEGMDIADTLVIDACLWIDAWQRRLVLKQVSSDRAEVVGTIEGLSTANGVEAYYKSVAQQSDNAISTTYDARQDAQQLRARALVELALSTRRNEHREFIRRVVDDVPSAIKWYTDKTSAEAVFHIMLAARISSRVPVSEASFSSSSPSSSLSTSPRRLSASFSTAYIDDDENALAAACRAGPSKLDSLLHIMHYLLCPWKWQPHQEPDNGPNEKFETLGGVGKTGVSSKTLVLLLDETSRHTGMTAAAVAAVTCNADALLALHLQGANLCMFASPGNSGTPKKEPSDEVSVTEAKSSSTESDACRFSDINTPPQSHLMLAARSGSVQCVELMLSAGVACSDIFDAWGRTARDVASESCVMLRDVYQTRGVSNTLDNERFQYRPDVAQCAMLLGKACGCCCRPQVKDVTDLKRSSRSNNICDVYHHELPWLLNKEQRRGDKYQCSHSILPGPCPSALFSNRVSSERRSATWALEQVVRPPRHMGNLRHSDLGPFNGKNEFRDSNDGLPIQPRDVAHQYDRLSIRPDWGECGPYSPRAKKTHVPSPAWRTPAGIDRELVLARLYNSQSPYTHDSPEFEGLPVMMLARKLRRIAHDSLLEAFGHGGSMDAVMNCIYSDFDDKSNHMQKSSVRVAAFALAAARGSRSGGSEYPGATVLHAAAKDGYSPSPQLVWALHCMHFSGILPMVIEVRDADGMTALLRAVSSHNLGSNDHVLALLQHGADFIHARVQKPDALGENMRPHRNQRSLRRRLMKSRCPGDTALHLAARKDDAALCALILCAVERFFEEQERNLEEVDLKDGGGGKTESHNKYHSHKSLRAAELVREWMAEKNADGQTAAEVCPAYNNEQKEENYRAAEERAVHHEYMNHRGFGSIRPRMLLHPTSPCLSILMGTEDAPVLDEYEIVKRFNKGTYRPPTNYEPWVQWQDIWHGDYGEHDSSVCSQKSAESLQTHRGTVSLTSLPPSFSSPGERLCELQRLERLACLAEDAEEIASQQVREAEERVRKLQLEHDSTIQQLKATESNKTSRQVDRYQAKMKMRKLIAIAEVDQSAMSLRRREGRWFPGSQDSKDLEDKRQLFQEQEAERIRQRDARRAAASDIIDKFDEQEKRRKIHEKQERIKRMEKRKRDLRRKARQKRRQRGEKKVSSSSSSSSSSEDDKMPEDREPGEASEQESPPLTQQDRMNAETTLHQIKENEEIVEERLEMPLNIEKLQLSFLLGRLDLRTMRRKAARDLVSVATVAVRTAKDFKKFQRRAGIGSERGGVHQGGRFDFTRLLKNGSDDAMGRIGSEEGTKENSNGHWDSEVLSSDTSSSSAPDSDSEDEESKFGKSLSDEQRIKLRKENRRLKCLAEEDHLAVDPRTYGHHLITSPGIPY